MLLDRTIIPKSLRREVLSTLHSAHQGTLSMGLRAEQVVYWPGMWTDIKRVREKCDVCNRIAPSQSNLPPVEPIVPDYPFQHVAVDYMTVEGENYGVFVDRYSGWPGVITGTQAKDVVSFFANLCQTYGCPETLTSDGAPNLTAKVVEDMLIAYGVKHRISSVANPHANSRAELGVKTVKRMIRDCIGNFGKLDGAKFSRALLTLRNTPARDTRLSPAMCLFGRPMRDFLPTQKGQLMGDMWRELASYREQSLAKRGTAINERLNRNVRRLLPLEVGNNVFIQNQTGNYPKRWNKRGVVISSEGYDQYLVRVDGSRHVTRRNRKFLKPFEPYRPPDSVVHVKQPVGGEGEIVSDTAADSESPVSVVPSQPTDCSSHAVGGSDGSVAPALDSPGPQDDLVVRSGPVGEATSGRAERAVDRPPSPEGMLRRSNRAGRGTTTRFQDYCVE